MASFLDQGRILSPPSSASIGAAARPWSAACSGRVILGVIQPTLSSTGAASVVYWPPVTWSDLAQALPAPIVGAGCTLDVVAAFVFFSWSFTFRALLRILFGPFFRFDPVHVVFMPTTKKNGGQHETNQKGSVACGGHEFTSNPETVCMLNQRARERYRSGRILRVNE